jgi:hypothetical protein
VSPPSLSFSLSLWHTLFFLNEIMTNQVLNKIVCCMMESFIYSAMFFSLLFYLPPNSRGTPCGPFASHQCAAAHRLKIAAIGIWRRMVGWQMNDDLGRIWKYWNTIPGICLEGLRKTTKDLTQDNRRRPRFEPSICQIQVLSVRRHHPVRCCRTLSAVHTVLVLLLLFEC